MTRVNRPSLLDRLNKNGKTTDLNKLANLMNQGSNLLEHSRYTHTKARKDVNTW